MKKILNVLLILPILLLIISGDNRGIAKQKVWDSSKEIDSLIESKMKKGKIPGLAIVLIKDEEIYKKAYGYADTDLKVPVTTSTYFELGSTTKAFTALAILKLANEGIINLNDNINKYIPSLDINHKGEKVNISVNELLQHTSGISFYQFASLSISNNKNNLERDLESKPITLVNSPGASFNYSSINYDILGLLIQKVTRKSYEEYIEGELLPSIGLKNTFVDPEKIPDSMLATGYKTVFFSPSKYVAPTYKSNVPAGYLYSNINEFEKWIKFHLHNESNIFLKLNKELSIFKTDFRIEGNIFYGYGWYIEKQGHKNTYYHRGDNPNYSSYISFIPEEGLGVAVLTNVSSDFTDNIGESILNIVRKKTIVEDIKDTNMNYGKVLFGISIFLCITLTLLLAFTIRLVRQIIYRERIFIKKHLCFILLNIILTISVIYSFSILPNLLDQNISWGFLVVWLPTGLQFTLLIALLNVIVIFIYLQITLFSKKVILERGNIYKWESR